jgi:hypothetical protein
MFYLSEYRLLCNRKQKCKFWNCPTPSAMHLFAVFHTFVMQPGEEFCATHTVHQTGYCRSFGTGESRNASLNSFWQVRNARWCSTVNTRCTIERERERERDCISTVERQVTYWRAQLATWRDLRVSCMGTAMCVFINPVELCCCVATSKYFNMGRVSFRSLCFWT